jgi:ribosomal protein S18 acetylase RimI-like enzyme
VATVRRATNDERTRAITTSVRAFVADPLIRWMFPDDATYDELGSLFMGFQFDVRVDAGEVWCTDDVATVAMWDKPAAPRDESFWNEMVKQLPEDTQLRLEHLGGAVGPHHLEEPHWYLGILATHPDWQRQGLGRAVLAPVLERADADGLTSVLLTESPENVAFYRAIGFDVVAEPDIPGGPPVWVMHRPARS